MAYTPKTWKDHILSDINYNIRQNEDGSYAVTPHGEVITQGTPMNAENFNHMENGIADAHTEIAQLESGKVDKVTGKGLSTNDYTTEEKNKLAGLSNYDDTNINNNMVRAGTADSNGQNQLFKTVNGVSTNVDPKCSLATNASGVHQQFTGTNKIRPLLLGNKEGNTGTSAYDGPTLYSNYLWTNPSTGELHAPMFKGGINTKVNLESTTTNAWRKICEYSSEGHRNAGRQCGIVIEMLVYNTKDTSPKGGTALLKIMTYTDPNYPDKNELFIDFSAGRINRNNVYAHMDPSSFKLTYTDVDDERIYKLWYYVTNTGMGTGFTILSAASSYQSKSIANDINLIWGTLSTGATGYMNDNGVAATGVVDCEMGVIGNDIAGNAATATKLSGPQTVLYESTTATTSFTLSGLFTDWSAVMIYLTGEWVSGTSGTHGFFVPLKHLKNRGNGGIQDFCGNKVINFLYVDDDSMRWFEYNGQGAMTYSSVKVVGLY